MSPHPTPSAAISSFLICRSYSLRQEVNPTERANLAPRDIVLYSIQLTFYRNVLNIYRDYLSFSIRQTWESGENISDLPV
jgi:hypothetical protein